MLVSFPWQGKNAKEWHKATSWDVQTEYYKNKIKYLEGRWLKTGAREEADVLVEVVQTDFEVSLFGDAQNQSNMDLGNKLQESLLEQRDWNS